MSQAFRLSEGGGIDRAQLVTFTFDGRRYQGYAGDTLASALLANGVRLVGRSFKYHRPRGVVGLGSEEPNALVRVGRGGRVTPNLRATQVPIEDGLVAESQNRWPTLDWDLGAINSRFARFLPAGFYYKTFMAPAAWWMTYEKVIRRMAGLGKPPEHEDPDAYEKRHAHVDILIAGGGPAGLAAALAAARNAKETGKRILVADENPAFGGSLLNGPAMIDGRPAAAWVEETVAALQALPNVTLLTRATVFGYYDHDFLTIAEHGTFGAARQRLWKVRAKKVILATGAIERPLAFADNDRPGVMLAGAVRGYLHRYGVRCGDTMAVLTNNDAAYACAAEAKAAGMAVAAIADLRAEPGADALTLAREAGIAVLPGHAVAGVSGTKAVQGVRLRKLNAAGDGFDGPAMRIACDLVAVSGGWTPAVHLHSQAKGKLDWDEDLAAFRPGRRFGANVSAGACNGTLDLAGCLAEGAAAAGGGIDLPATGSDLSGAPHMLWRIPAGRGAKRFVDLQNDVTTSDVALAAREGYRSVEHLKRYTTLGMGTDQGKTSNHHGLALLAGATDRAIPDVGTTTFRPPYTPVTVGLFAGRDKDAFAHPVRRTALHDWHVAQGAPMTDAGLWKRPQAYPRPGESLNDAIRREVLAVRDNVGLVDVTTLGKIDIQGPDAAELLNRMYINAWKKLPVGKGRYGLMLREDGMVWDDGVTMRLAEHHFLMTTTTANAAAVLQQMEFLLQTQWPDLKVFVNSVTEHWFAAAVSGPNARQLLNKLTTDIDMSNDAFPMMAIRQGTVAGLPARVLRISFSGELSYEVNVAADDGVALWQAVLDAGEELDLTVYGTEAMGVLRIEKGHVAGPELDGRTTADDLGLGRMVNANKDCIGKRSLDRPGLNETGRLQLVGLECDDADGRIPFGARIVAEHKDGAQDQLGHVTSIAQSPVLERSIALALVRDGRNRHGEHVYAASPTADGGKGAWARVRVTGPVFFDPEGERLHG